MHGHTTAGLTKGVNLFAFSSVLLEKAIQVINVILYWKLKAQSLSQIEKSKREAEKTTATQNKIVNHF